MSLRACVVGLGAVGGLIASRLATSGQPVSALVRQGAFEALRRNGLTLIESADGRERRSSVPINAALDPHDLGVQDVVVLSVKTTALAQVAARVAPLIGPQTIVVSAMNGIQWWFFEGLDPALRTRDWPAIDPGRRIAAAIPPANVIGCVVHLSCATLAPAVVRHAQGNRLIVGATYGASAEAAGPLSKAETSATAASAAVDPRVGRVAALLRAGGFEVEERAQIQQDVWFKLWGNMTMNPISALTGATGDKMLDDPLVLAFISRAMREATAIGARIGLPIVISPEERHEVTRKLGAFRTSMLQDLEAGRPLELDALVTIVADIGRAVDVPTPDIDALLGLARLQARVRGLYP